MAEISEIKRAASGLWTEILQAHGVPDHALTGKHCPCPGCGGKDRFRYEGGNDGRWICGGGGNTTGGDGFALLQHIGFGAGESFKAVANYLGIVDRPLSQQERQEIAKRKQAVEFQKLDDAIFHEINVLVQTIGKRISSRANRNNKALKASRPEWVPYPVEVWEREAQAAKRLIAWLAIRYTL